MNRASAVIQDPIIWDTNHNEIGSHINMEQFRDTHTTITLDTKN